MAARVPILHSDEHLVVVSKSAGVSSIPDAGSPGSSLPELLEEQGIRALPVHRLDRDVSGALLLARHEEARARLEQLFRAREVRKTYWAMAQGRVEPGQGAWQFPILEEGARARVSALGRKSVTRYRTLEHHAEATTLEIDLVTGRYNQIRLHFAHAGFPLVGERKYARGKDATVRMRSRRVALHSWKLGFVHPFDATALEVTAPLPPDLLELLERARMG